MPSPVPGSTITTAGGGVGRYVGELHGVQWIAYEGEDFALVSEAFAAACRRAARRGAR